MTKETHEAAVFEVGQTFGRAFQIGYGHVDEFKTDELDRLTQSDQFTIENLKISFLGGRILFAKAFEPVIRRDPQTHAYTVGIRFSEDSDILLPGSEVVIDEFSFVKGFIKGYRDSQSIRATEQVAVGGNGEAVSA